VLYVRAGGAGDGSRSAPFGTVSAALAVATGGTLVAVGPGDFDEAVVLPGAVELRGVCAARTSVRSILAGGAGVVIRDVSIGPSDGPGLDVAGHDARVEGVVVTGARTAAIVVDGGELDAEGVLAVDTEGSLTDGLGGAGLDVRGGGRATLRRGVVAGNRDAGVLARADAVLSLEDVAVRDTRSEDATRSSGHGLYAHAGADVTAARIVLERNRTLGVLAVDGAAVRLADAVVRDTQPREADSEFGRGLAALRGASIAATRISIERNRNVGAFGFGSGTLVRLEDAVIRDTDSAMSDGGGGRGFNVQDAARGELVRVVATGNRDVSVFAIFGSTVLDIRDLVASGTRDQRVDPRGGWGLGFQTAATGRVSRVRLEDNEEIGLFAAVDGTRVEIEDLDVRDTESLSVDGAMGRAVNVQGGARVTVTRASLERSREIAFFVSGTATTAAVTDLSIATVVPPACDGEGCPNAPTAFGAFNGGAALANTFRIVDSDGCGVHVSSAGELDLVDGEITGCSIGACVQVDGYALERLSNRVDYRDNGVNLQAISLPVPNDAPPI
jgi:hypothetical protein